MGKLTARSGVIAENARFYGPLAALRYESRNLYFLLCRTVFRLPSLKARVGGRTMILSTRLGGISRELFVYGGREADHLFILEQEIEKGMRILDVGANIGYYALIEADLAGPGGEVIALEPDPRNLPLLRENVAAAGLETTVKVVESALSNFTGKARLGQHRFSNLSAIVEGGTPREGGDFEGFAEVEAVDTAAFLAENRGVGLMRMDIEGHEVRVLEGVERLLRKDPGGAPKKIVFEAHPELYGKGLDMAGILEAMLGHYDVRWVSARDGSASGQMRRAGFRAERSFRTDLHERDVFRDVPGGDAAAVICERGWARIVLLTRRGS